MTVRKFRILFLRLCSLPLIFLAVFVRPVWPVGSRTGFAVELAGYLLMLVGLIIRIWSILYIGGRKSNQLVTDGPYSLCRHPLYVGTFLVAAGVGLAFENIPMLIAIVGIIAPIHLFVMHLEERHMSKRFPEDFAAYRQRVPWLCPRLRGYTSAEKISVSVRSIRRVLIDTVAVLLVPEVEDFLEVLHDQGILPVLWYFPS